ncbi:MAG: hypothetical protein K0B00_12595 [Rhodobacteraceae bacterium]|nr:hypothetical protein [Paracoccaceae bacterium]
MRLDCGIDGTGKTVGPVGDDRRQKSERAKPAMGSGDLHHRGGVGVVFSCTPPLPLTFRSTKPGDTRPASGLPFAGAAVASTTRSTRPPGGGTSVPMT